MNLLVRLVANGLCCVFVVLIRRCFTGVAGAWISEIYQPRSPVLISDSMLIKRVLAAPEKPPLALPNFGMSVYTDYGVLMD